jgi:predicted PurR-regulated permease PerM
MRPEVVRLAWIVAAVAVTVLLLQRLASVLVPFCAAALLAYLCAPFVAWLQSRRVPRLLAVMVVMALAVLVVVGLMLVVVPTIGAQITALLEELPEVIEWYRHTVVPWANSTLRVDLPENAERARTLVANALQAGGDLSQRLLPSLTSGGLALLSLLGHRVGLHPVWVLFAVLAGGALLGFIGMLLAVPVAAVVLVLLRHAKAHYLASRLYTS